MEQLIHIARGLIDIAAFIGIAYALSANRKAIDWRLVAVGMALQIVFGWLVLYVDAVRCVIDWVGRGFVSLLEFNRAGAEFRFGGLVTDTQTFS